MLDQTTKEHLFTFLSEQGFNLQKIELFPCLNGGNNITIPFRYEENKILIKMYFSDNRDRLGAEWAFLNYAISQGIYNVPLPIAKDSIKKIALYQYIDGIRPLKTEITSHDIEQAIDFIKNLNKEKEKRDINLPLASDACFSIKDHFLRVDNRIQSLQSIEYKGHLDIEFTEFVRELSSKWGEIKNNIQNLSRKKGISITKPIEKNLWCISPSDFGFHNSLRVKSGELFFVDFEYAGWDDPAKMVADFFLQPAIPIDPQFIDCFMTKIFSMYKDPNKLMTRCSLLGSIFVIKWCCIILNCFIPEYLRRDLYKIPAKNIEKLQEERLTNAKNYLSHSFFFNYLCN